MAQSLHSHPKVKAVEYNIDLRQYPDFDNAEKIVTEKNLKLNYLGNYLFTDSSSEMRYGYLVYEISVVISKDYLKDGKELGADDFPDIPCYIKSISAGMFDETNKFSLRLEEKNYDFVTVPFDKRYFVDEVEMYMATIRYLSELDYVEKVIPHFSYVSDDGRVNSVFCPRYDITDDSNCIELVLFPEYSGDNNIALDLDISPISEFIPDGIEIEKIIRQSSEDGDEMNHYYIYIKNSSAEKCYKLAEALSVTPLTLYTDMYVDFSDDTISDVTSIVDTEIEFDDTASDVIADNAIEDNAETNNNKPTGDSLFAFLLIALFTESIALTVIVIKRNVED